MRANHFAAGPGSQLFSGRLRNIGRVAAGTAALRNMVRLRTVPTAPLPGLEVWTTIRAAIS